MGAFKKLLTTIWRGLTFPFRMLWRGLRWLFTPFIKAYLAVHTYLTYEPEENTVGDTVDKVIRSPSVLAPHINDLRKALFRALLALALTTAVSFTFAENILSFLSTPLPDGLDSLQAIEVTEPISVLMRIALLSGFALGLPYLLLELIIFIGSGLSKSTRKFLIFGAIPSAIFLFFLGMAFAYYVMLPAAVPFLLGIFEFETNVRASSYIRFVTGVMFWIGVTFQLPLIVYIVARLGWVEPQVLLKQWRVAVVMIAILAAVITPTIDVVNMSLTMAPLIVLYFISVGLAFLAVRSRKRAQAKQPA